MSRTRLFAGIIAIAMGLGVATPAMAQGAAAPGKITFVDWDRVDHASAWSRSVEYAAGFTTGFGEGAVSGATAIASGVWQSAVFLPKLAIHSDYRQGVWNSVVSGAKAARDFTETAVTDPHQAANEVGSASRAAWDGLQSAYGQAAAEGRGSEFIGQMFGQGAVLLSTAFVVPGGAEAGSAGVVDEAGGYALRSFGGGGKLASIDGQAASSWEKLIGKLGFSRTGARVGLATSNDYRTTFFAVFPKLVAGGATRIAGAARLIRNSVGRIRDGKTGVQDGRYAETITRHTGTVAPITEGVSALSTSIIERINELREAIPDKAKGYVTMAVGRATDLDGTEKILVATSEPGGYLREGVTLKPWEILVTGYNHAEMDIINYAKENGLTLHEVGATRPICSMCASAINEAGAKPVTALKAN